ncbi:hypothetical protein A5M85_09300 [Cellulophaga lytica]|uniref:hypothetical protein n=1 Tax=Cellulophaga lytica TaxID=979 RepID=UPI0009506BC7|nr:hypothetical protein [Cellulophaga lytica]APU10470.1 hypothetical protein A5M85_09300 [Cellulophaga lytica]
MITIEPFINIIIALLGLAYPILLQVIARLNEKYESENIATLFKTEWEWKAFRYTLVASLLSVLIWTLKLKPLFKIGGLNLLIENSATLLIVLSSTLLVISFFFFVGKVLKYYTPYSIIPYLIKGHNNSKNEIKYFPALADLLLLSIRKQQTNLSLTLSDFFYSEYRTVREKPNNTPVEYPDEYYDTVYKAIEELSILKEKRNYLLEHRTSGGIWLLGEMQGKEISEKTYLWLWRNLLLAVRYKQDDLIVNHWETCHQYYSYSLPYIHEEYDNTTASYQVSNRTEVDKRLSERKKFIEFHYALGGLLTYKQRYLCIKRLFSYTQSQPPRYELLPESMQDIFSFYFEVRDPYERNYPWISHQYPFPELSGVSSDGVIKKWIMSYMAILFLRQYTIIPYSIIIKPLNYPSIPHTQGEIKSWIDGLDFFKKLLVEHLENEELLNTLNLEFITQAWCDENDKPYPTTFIDTMKSSLQEAYENNTVNITLSEDKIGQFKGSSKVILESAFESLNPINNTIYIPDNESDKWYVNGQSMLHSKDAFSENPEAHHIEFDSFLGTVAAKSLKEGLSEVFLRKNSKSYLLKSEDLFKAIDLLKVDEKYVIVNFGINLDRFINHIKVPKLSIERYKKIKIHSFDRSHIVRDSLFILKLSDLPNVTSRTIENSPIEKYSLDKISDSMNLYCSVLDMNQVSEEIFKENEHNKSEDEIRKSVLLSIIFSIEYKWKRYIEVIQLRQYSEIRQQGIANKLEDIIPLEKAKNQ